MSRTGVEGSLPAGTGRALRVAAGVAVASATALMGCGGGSDATGRTPAGSPVDVQVAEVAPVSWSDSLEVTATVQAIRQAMPATVLMGRVEQILHREGDRVSRGAVLARVESREVSARLAQAEAAVIAARAQEENARVMKERLERLYERQAAPKKHLDDAVAGYEAARAGREAAEEGVKAARMYVGYSEITAPFDGLVTARRVEAGDLASPGMPLFVVEDLSRVKVEAQVPESSLPRLSPGGAVEVDVPVAGGSRAGSLAEILPSADPSSRTFTVRVLLDNPDGLLRSGMFARLRMAGEPASALVVPRRSVVHRGPLTGVFAVDESGVAQLRWVTLGESRDGTVRLLSGLTGGERVVVEPPPELTDGQPVRVR